MLVETSWNTLKAMCGIMTSFKLTSQSEACTYPTSQNTEVRLVLGEFSPKSPPSKNVYCIFTFAYQGQCN